MRKSRFTEAQIIEMIKEQDEVSAHGWRWERHVYMDEVEERRVIARTVETLARSAGTPPVGWHTRSAMSEATRRLMIEQGGFLCDSNAYNDDLPYTVDTVGGLEAFLDHVAEHPGVRVAKRAEIAQAGRSAVGQPEWHPRPCPAAFATGSA